jgi:hypothetical protein
MHSHCTNITWFLGHACRSYPVFLVERGSFMLIDLQAHLLPPCSLFSHWELDPLEQDEEPLTGADGVRPC